MNKKISIATGLLTLLLAIFSFILSFNALTELAKEHNVSVPFLFPDPDKSFLPRQNFLYEHLAPGVRLHAYG